jgi:hypothetical protein
LSGEVGLEHIPGEYSVSRAEFYTASGQEITHDIRADKPIPSRISVRDSVLRVVPEPSSIDEANVELTDDRFAQPIFERSGFRKEQPMDVERYWYLGMSSLSIPWWTEVIKWGHAEGIERVDAPMLFTSKGAAEEQLREVEGAEADNYLRLVNALGEDEVNEAWSNTPQTKIFGVDEGSLLDALQDSDFLCVMVDGRMKLRQDFVEELRGQLELREE